MRASLAALLLLLSAFGAAAQTRTDINMVVALDRSESISSLDAALQIQGLIYALKHPEFLAAIQFGEHRRIGVSVIKWSSFNRYATLLPWQIVADKADADRVSAMLGLLLLQGPGSDDGSQTDVALGIERGMAMLAEAPTAASKEVINMIADGISNIGHVAVVERDAAMARGITINALILAQGSAIRVLTSYYRREVIGGPASFVLHTPGHEDFARAMLRKMLVEVAELNRQIRDDELGGMRG
ncbi:MAG: DUF1194 domain-containing protein [Alphaproteobacteria bacterium]